MNFSTKKTIYFIVRKKNEDSLFKIGALNDVFLKRNQSKDENIFKQSWKLCLFENVDKKRKKKRGRKKRMYSNILIEFGHRVCV